MVSCPLYRSISFCTTSAESGVRSQESGAARSSILAPQSVVGSRRGGDRGTAVQVLGSRRGSHRGTAVHTHGVVKALLCSPSVVGGQWSVVGHRPLVSQYKT